MNLRSEIDSNRFGFPVGKAFSITAETVESIVDQSKAEGLRLLFVRCLSDDWATVHTLEHRGFLLMDTLLYLRRELDGNFPVPNGEAQIRSARPEDLGVFNAVARKTFAGFCGHYNADSRLDQSVVSEIYPSWASNALTCKAVADEMLVAQIDGNIIGFGALKVLGGGITDGLLYGVLPEFRRRGVFRDLILASLHWGRDRGFTAMDYSTQLTNIAAQSAVTQLGFLPRRSVYTFHLWLD